MDYQSGKMLSCAGQNLQMVVQMKHESTTVIKDLEDVKAFVKLNLAKEEYFKKLWKKASKT
jgi:hypothetical protein